MSDDRPCNRCRKHKEGGCESWECDPELNGMTIEQIDDILQHPKKYWSHQVEEAREAAKQVVHILADYSETIDARRFIDKTMKGKNDDKY